MYDSVYTFAYGLHSFELYHKFKKFNLSCNIEEPWIDGATLFNYINSVDYIGITGPIKFFSGNRIEFNLEIIKLINNEIIKVGEWRPNYGLIINKTAMWNTNKNRNSNVTLSVVSILETPFIMMHYGKNYTGNERFYGFCVDILDKIAYKVGFEYILDLVPDRKYGAKDPLTGEWNGMVSQLIKYKADLAVGPMTINYARESVIDFTEPFMNLGIGLLYKKPELQQTRSFSFMIPFKKNIWISAIIVYILTSLTMYLITLISPYEFGCHRLSLKNCFWLSIVILMQQDSNINPTAPSTRIAVSSWMYFSLVMISSYTANLAAFFTVERMTTPIKNINDLGDQTEITYGTLESGSTMSFFRDSTIEQHKKMWRFMDNKRPSVFPSTYDEGINRVLHGNYAFLMESTMIDYTIQRNCNLTQIGGLIDSKNYGIATQYNSPWRDKISLAILELREKGELQILYNKWWKIINDECSRTDKLKQVKANALSVDSIGGIFLVLIIGIIFASFIALYEFYFADKHHYDNELTLKNHETQQSQSICTKIHRELRSAIRCTDSSTRTALRRQCPNCELLTKNDNIINECKHNFI